MLHYLQPLIDYIHHHPRSGAMLAFLISFSESLPIIGTIIPGSVTMTALGALIGTGVLPGSSTLIWAALGALVGDSIGFGLGYLLVGKINDIWPFKKYPQWLVLSEQFFKKHGGKSIIIGRFVGPARSTVPMVAGLLKMGLLRFLMAAIPSAALWAVIYILPGILLGVLAVELPPHVSTEFLLTGLAIIVGLWLIFWALQYFFGQLTRGINRLVHRLWTAALPCRFARPCLRLIATKGRPDDYHQLTFLLLCLLSLLAFFSIFYAVIEQAALTHLNAPLFFLLQSLRGPRVDGFFIVITALGGSLVMFSGSCLISLGLFIRGCWRAALHVGLVAVAMTITISVLKGLHYSPRPTGFTYFNTSSSFPSGHTGMSFIVLGTLAYFTRKLVSPTVKRVCYSVVGILLLLIALSRLYLGAHWLTDILGSITLAVAFLCMLILLERRHTDTVFQTISVRYWLALVCVSLLLPWAVGVYAEYRIPPRHYVPLQPIVKMSPSRWWAQPTVSLPLYRLNRFGAPVQPFNLQWEAEHLSVVQTQLQQAGWTIVDPAYSVKGTLERFIDRDTPFHLPLLPWLYGDRPPVLIAMKRVPAPVQTLAATPAPMIELRLWKSGVILVGGLPLWIGTVNFYIPPPKKLHFARFKDISLQSSGGIRLLMNDLEQRYPDFYQKKIAWIPWSLQPAKVQALYWDGHILVIRQMSRYKRVT